MLLFLCFLKWCLGLAVTRSWVQLPGGEGHSVCSLHVLPISCCGFLRALRFPHNQKHVFRNSCWLIKFRLSLNSSDHDVIKSILYSGGVSGAELRLGKHSVTDRVSCRAFWETPQTTTVGLISHVTVAVSDSYPARVFQWGSQTHECARRKSPAMRMTQYSSVFSVRLAANYEVMRSCMRAMFSMLSAELGLTALHFLNLFT